MESFEDIIASVLGAMYCERRYYKNYLSQAVKLFLEIVEAFASEITVSLEEIHGSERD